MMKHRKNLGTRIYDFIDWIGHRLPTPFLRAFSMPVAYQSNTVDIFAYESTRMVSMATSIIKNNQIVGDYVEFGVFQGRTFIEACLAAERLDIGDMRFWAFDSFAGLPVVKGLDEGGEFTTGQFAFSQRDFVGNLRRYGVDLERVEIVEGFFEETLRSSSKKNLPESVAIAWIDCDLYESTVPVLDFLTTRLVDGAIVIFDDWYSFGGNPNRGEQRACREWLERNPEILLLEYHKYHWGGNSFIFIRNEVS